jgi:hypothetical protein
MWVVWTLVAMLSVAGYVAMSAELREAPVSTASAADLAWNLGVYRDAVLTYALQHPGFAGTVPDSALPLPPWYTPAALWRNQITAGVVAVYGTHPMTAELASSLVALGKGSYFVGIADAKSGRLVSPLFGDTGLALPPGIPDGVPVWLAMAA